MPGTVAELFLLVEKSAEVQGSRIDCRENKARTQSKTERRKVRGKAEENLLRSKGEGRRGSALGREEREREIEIM